MRLCVGAAWELVGPATLLGTGRAIQVLRDLAPLLVEVVTDGVTAASGLGLWTVGEATAHRLLGAATHRSVATYTLLPGRAGSVEGRYNCCIWPPSNRLDVFLLEAQCLQFDNLILKPSGLAPRPCNR